MSRRDFTYTISYMRLFVAIDPPSDILDILEESIGMFSRGNKRTGNISWVPRENLHLTVFFIGEVPYQDLEGVEMRMEEALNDVPSFYITIDKYVFFPDKLHPRIIGVSVNEQSGFLKNIYSTLAKSFSGYAEKKEHKKFVPHITIGRSKMNRPLQMSNVSQGSGVFKVDEVLLKESLLSPVGAEYKIKKRFKL